MNQYFIKTFKIKDAEGFNFDLEMFRNYLPEGVALKGGATPIFSFNPQGVTVAIEVVDRRIKR